MLKLALQENWKFLWDKFTGPQLLGHIFFIYKIFGEMRVGYLPDFCKLDCLVCVVNFVINFLFDASLGSFALNQILDVPN